MSHYSRHSDDFYVNMNLNTEMELPNSRDAVLHFFDRLQKQYPTMTNFYCRDNSEFVLEEDKEQGQYRWATIESSRVSSGYVNAENLEESLAQHRLVLELVPYLLSVTPLDCESLNLTFGFDFTYQGNHNELVAEVLGVVPAFERLADHPSATLTNNEPSIQMAMDEDCRVQCRVSLETRTTAYHVRTGQFPEEQLSVYVTARRYGSLDSGEDYVDAMQHLSEFCQEMVDNHVIDHILRPLQQAIAIK